MAQRATAGAAGGPGTRAESTGPGSTERPRGPGNVLQRKRGSERSRDRCGLSSAQQQPPECQVPILESVNGDVYGKGPCGFDQIKGSQKGDYMASLVGSMQGSVRKRRRPRGHRGRGRSGAVKGHQQPPEAKNTMKPLFPQTLLEQQGPASTWTSAQGNFRAVNGKTVRFAVSSHHVCDIFVTVATGHKYHTRVRPSQKVFREIASREMADGSHHLS